MARGDSRAGTEADRAYRRWIRNSRPFIPLSAVQAFAKRAVLIHGDQKRAAYAAGVSEKLIYRVLHRPAGGIEYVKGEQIAAAAEMRLQFALAVPPPGADDWSRHGRFCGDGSGPELDGCGTFHHEHYLDGLCAECWRREITGVEGEPRDVRESKPKGERHRGGAGGRTSVRKAAGGDDPSDQLSLL